MASQHDVLHDKVRETEREKKGQEVLIRLIN